ncbi:MAG: SAM-dependent methyltransferase [Polyangiaceae bacterium]
MSNDGRRPHISRIYDYVLGGTFNHEVDREAAEVMIDRMPSYPRWARQNRSFLASAGKRWAREGRERVLDLGSGLPTQGHFNSQLPGARILFTDFDEETVAAGRGLLGGVDHMEYAHLDLKDVGAVIAAAQGFFGDERALAVGLIGVMYFLSDEHVRALAQALHDLAAPGSVLSVSFPSVMGELNDSEKATIAAMQRSANIEFFHRTKEQVAQVLAPWKILGFDEVADPAGPASATPNPRDSMGRFRVLGGFAERA